jgi:hypothetical protein
MPIERQIDADRKTSREGKQKKEIRKLNSEERTRKKCGKGD